MQILSAGQLEAALGCITRFPSATKVYLKFDLGRCSEQGVMRLIKALAALPDGCWPTVEAFTAQNGLPAPMAEHVVPLCPRLWEININCAKGEADALAAALEEAAAGALEALHLRFADCPSLGNAPQVCEALANLTGLRRLKIDWGGGGPADASGLLGDALSALASLSSLEVAWWDSKVKPPPQLGVRPDALRELGLLKAGGCGEGLLAVKALRAAPQLPGVTRLALHG